MCAAGRALAPAYRLLMLTGSYRGFLTLDSLVEAVTAPVTNGTGIGLLCRHSVSLTCGDEMGTGLRPTWSQPRRERAECPGDGL